MAWTAYVLPLISDAAGHRGPKYLGSRAAPIDSGLSGAAKTITGASNASPIVLTSNGHGLATGQVVVVEGVTGNTAANGRWRVTAINANTFSLDGSGGNGAYAGGGTALLVVDWALTDYGKSPWCLVAADVSAAQHTFLTGQSDVAALPTNLDSQLGANQSAARDFLEAAGIPGTWITGSSTYRQVARSVIGLFNFANRYLAIAGDTVIPAGQSLNTQFGSLTGAQQQAYRDTCADFGIDDAFLTSQATLRAILKALADLWADTARTLGGLSI